MRINATDTVQIGGTSVTGFASGLYAQAFSTQVATDPRYALSRLIAQYGVLPANLGQGSAGEILVSANSLAVTNGGNITSRSETQGNAGAISINLRDKLQVNNGEISVSSKGSGNGGDLSIAARSIFLDNQGKLLAETAAGDGGNISLQAGEFILLRHNSLISATAGGQGNGGNIKINSPFIVAVPAENSDIIANAFKGRGGNININTFGIYGLQFRSRLTPRSDITASSDFGVNGTVQINTLGVDPSHGLNNLPINVVDAEKLVGDRCSASLESRRSQFVVFGRGGLPPTPQEVLNGDALTINWVTLPSTEVVNLPEPKLTVNQLAIADCFRSHIPK
jgi:large exoprotein involved in heme utilization and adhesion